MIAKAVRSALVLAVGGLAAALAAAQTTINFRFHDPEAAQMRKALDDFEKANPDIKVNLQRANFSDGRQQYLREAAAGTGPDVVEIVYVWARPFGAAKALRPLDDLVAKGGLGIKGWDDFIARDLALGPDNKIYAIPYTTDTFALVYNKDLLAAAGVRTPPKTWPELLEASRLIKQKTGKAGFAFPAASCPISSVWFYLNFYWWSKGLNLVEQGPDGRYRVGMNAAQIADGFAYFNNYVRDGLNPQNLQAACSYGGPEFVEGMVNGDIAMGSVHDAVALRIIAGWKERNPGKPSPFATTIHPADTKPSTTHFGGRMVAISPNSKNVDAAWRLVQFLTKPDPTFTRYLTNYTPSQMEAVRTAKVEPGMEGFKEQLLNARSWGPYATGPVDIPVMWNAIGRAAGSVFARQRTPEQAAQDFLAQLNAEMAKNQK
ncbi:MAG TPA: sugar ABC transporter substrate-binding protein [Ramlibacter sp.]|nr:sugar ABC transporter substrate-binding protein [Ramlibacter sp.]